MHGPRAPRFQQNNYTAWGPNNRFLHAFAYPQHAFLGPCTIVFSHARGLIWPFLSMLNRSIRLHKRVNAADTQAARATTCRRESDAQDVELVSAADREGVIVPTCASLTDTQRLALTRLRLSGRV